MQNEHKISIHTENEFLFLMYSQKYEGKRKSFPELNYLRNYSAKKNRCFFCLPALLDMRTSYKLRPHCEATKLNKHFDILCRWQQSWPNCGGCGRWNSVDPPRRDFSQEGMIP